MASTFRLIITSVEGARFNGEAMSATIPGVTGEMTILAHHEPLISTLKKGIITTRTAAGIEKFEVERGIVECSNNTVTILV